MTATPTRTVPTPVGPAPSPASRPAPSGGSGSSPWLRVAAIAVALLCVLPLVVVVAKALESGVGEALALVWRPRVGELLRNSVSLVVLTGVLSTVIGVGAAWLVERTALPGASFWRVAFVAPLAVPAFVNSFAWSALVPGLEGLAGAVIVTTLSYFPFVFLPVAALLRTVDPGLEEASRALGHGPWRTALRVGLTQVRPALLGGVLLVSLHLLAEYGALEMLRFPTFTTAILDQFEVAFDSRSGSVLATILIGLATTLLTLELLARGRTRHVRLGSGTARRAPRARLGRATPLALLGVLALTGLALGVPAWSIGTWLSRSDQAMEPTNIGPAVWSTLGLGLVAALLTTLATLPAAWLVARSRSWLAVLLERVTYLAASLPGVVVALALITLTITYARPLYQTVFALVLAYVILFIPRAMVATRAAIAAVPPELGDAARALGDSPVRAFLRVQLPLMLRGTLAGSALVFIAVTTELTATLLLAPTGTRTLATAFWDASAALDYAAAAPYAAALVVLSAPLTYVLLRGNHEEPLT
ncbi:iron ABC transporter permease [Phycicoccus sp. SLBN-51]|uniref:ABC transporter permease n=1 Tax=Phycicoccus sp. SLBN-51 TaxID=2768447 RepID=UPI00114D90C0|nr:iron ABC transporter permease [Phycicoccus sp. SLBN-51]TQJ48559.1 iron(III) transport system permease protein [Phycicoccus sp. SLBN-51]